MFNFKIYIALPIPPSDLKITEVTATTVRLEVNILYLLNLHIKVKINSFSSTKISGRIKVLMICTIMFCNINQKMLTK